MLVSNYVLLHSQREAVLRVCITEKTHNPRITPCFCLRRIQISISMEIAMNALCNKGTVITGTAWCPNPKHAKGNASCAALASNPPSWSLGSDKYDHQDWFDRKQEYVNVKLTIWGWWRSTNTRAHATLFTMLVLMFSAIWGSGLLRPIGHFRRDEFQDYFLASVSGAFIYGIDNDEGPLWT